VTRRIATCLFVAVAAACATTSESEVRAGAVYDGIMRWFAAEQISDPDPLPIFVEPRGEGTSIDIAVQAEVVESAADVADVRFIDTRDEALATDEDEVVSVRDEGILIRLGPVLEEGRRVTLDVDQFVDDETERTLRFSLVATGDEWRVLGDPVVFAAG